MGLKWLGKRLWMSESTGICLRYLGVCARVFGDECCAYVGR